MLANLESKPIYKKRRDIGAKEYVVTRTSYAKPKVGVTLEDHTSHIPTVDLRVLDVKGPRERSTQGQSETVPFRNYPLSFCPPYIFGPNKKEMTRTQIGPGVLL